MASPAAAVQPEVTHPSPDSVAQEIAQDYTNQWHILEQLKSSVAVVDPLQETNNHQDVILTPQSSSNNGPADRTQEEVKVDEKDWYLLPDAGSSGHSSETEGDSALEISDLRNNADISYNSNRSTSSKSNSQSKEYLNKDSLYQEQWHVLEELKASVKAMQWGSDSSLVVSRKEESQSKSCSKNGDFVEPHKRTPAGSLNLTSGSIGSSNGTGSVARDAVHPQSNSSHTEQPSDAQLYSGTSMTSEHPESKNTSSDLSLESENLVFAELPNRPATIGNYGASDGSTYPFSTVSLPQQPLNINMGAPQQGVPSPFNTNVSPLVGSPLFFVPEYSSDGVISTSPMSARERLQPDGRDGPDLISAPQPGQTVPGLVSYPLSGGSSQNLSGTASHPLPGGSDFTTPNGTGNVLLGGPDMNQFSNPTNMNLGTVGDNSAISGLDSQAPVNSQFGFDPSGSNTSLQNVKEAQHSLTAPWQPNGSSSDATTAVTLQSDVANSKDTSITWLSSGGGQSFTPVTEESHSSSKRSSVTHDDLREAVLQRIEAHTQIPGFSREPSDFGGNTTQSDTESFVNRAQEFQTALPHSYQDSSSREATPKALSEHTSNLSHDSSAYLRQLDNARGTSRAHFMDVEQNENTSGNLKYDLKHSVSSTYSSQQYKSTSTTYSQLSEHSEPSVYPGRQYNAYMNAGVPALKTISSEEVKPSIVDPFKRSAIANSEYEQSPVSKLLGPNFKATQDYLNKLKTDRLNDTSVDTSSSSVQNDHDLKTTEHRSSGNFSQGSSVLNDTGFRPRKEAWSDHERSHQSQTYNFAGGEKSANEQGIPTYSFHHQASVSGNGDSSIPVSSSYSYMNSIDQYRMDSLGSANELDRGRTVQSFGQYSKPFGEAQSRISHSPLTGSEPKDTDVNRGSDLFMKRIDTYSKAPLCAKAGPSVLEVQPKLADYYHTSDSFSKTPLAPLETETSATSDGGYDSLQKVKDLISREKEVTTNVTKSSTYVTPLTSFRDKKAWGGEGRNLRYSAGSSAVMCHDDAEDTDDLLSYEAALEGDIKYFKNRRETSQNYHSSSINSKTEGPTPGHLTGDISAINGSVDRDPLRRIPITADSTGVGFTKSDEQTKRYHLSLGAGEVRPVEAFREPVGTLEGEESDGVLSSDALEIEDEDQKEDGNSTDRNITPATESSSSSLYQPYLPIALRQPPSAERESELTGNSSSTFGVYDIRHSSGPGSTNRRRKAMGLSPIPGRVPKPINGIVYVSGDSSPLSMPDDASADEKSKDGRNSIEETSKDTSKLSSGTSSTLHNSERSRTSSRSSRNKSRLDEGRPRSSSKEESYRARSRGSSFEEAKMIDDYVGGRKAIPQGKQTKPKTSRSRNISNSDDSQSSREFQSKNADLNQMWERFQESLRSSPRSKNEDSVSSHLSRLSALLSKPIDIITTSSETETEHFRKPRSHSYASSSSDVSTESDQPYDPQNYSLTRQIQLRKLLETVNVADVPTFPRLRHRDTTTTSSTLSDTSASEIPEVHSSLPRANRGSRKVSKTPALEPFVQTKPRSADSKPKCICAIKSSNSEPKPLQELAERRKQTFVEKKGHLPETHEVGFNFPTPKVQEKRSGRTKKVYVDVGVQTKRDSEDDSIIHRRKDNSKIAAKEKSLETNTEKLAPRRKERHLASQNSPRKHPQRLSPSRNKERHVASQNYSHDSTRLSDDTLVDASREQLNISRKDMAKGKHKERHPNSPDSKHKTHRSVLETSGPTWFYPMTNRHYSRPSPHPAVGPSKLQYDEQTVNTFSPPAAPPSASMQKLSLQDAFVFAKPDFVKRSRARLSRIERNKNLRENGESIATGEDRVSKIEIPASKPTANKPQQDPRTEKLHRPKPRQLSKKEMKTLNLKLYNNLPEVKAKKADNRRANFYRSNRLRAKLFDKRVRENLKKRYAA